MTAELLKLLIERHRLAAQRFRAVDLPELAGDEFLLFGGAEIRRNGIQPRAGAEFCFIILSRFCFDFGADFVERFFDGLVGLFGEEAHDDDRDASEDERGQQFIYSENAAEF